MLMFGVVVDDILECCCKEVDDMVEDGEEKFDTVMRLGGFTAELLQTTIINMPPKQFTPLAKGKRVRLLKQGTGAVTSRDQEHVPAYHLGLD